MGAYYLNLVRALADLYRQPQAEATVVAVSEPSPAAPGHDTASVVTGDRLALKWVYAGRAPQAWTLTLGGKVLAKGVTGADAAIDLHGFEAGRHMLRLIAEGTTSRYRLSWTEDSLPLDVPEPAYAEAPITVALTPR